MLYLLAIILPPFGVLLCGKPLQALLNLILTACFWIPGIVHALFVVQGHLADKRTNRVLEEMRQHRLDSILRR